MELLWIVLGIVYVIYRFFKGKDFEHGFGCLAAIAMFVIAALTESLLVAILVTMVVGIILVAYGFSHDNNERKNFEQEYAKKIPQKYIDKVKNTPGSPYRRDGVNSAECYVWLCREETNRLQHLPSKEFDEILGMSLADIPLDPEHPNDYKRRKNVVIELILQRDGLVFQEPDYSSLPIKSKLIYHDNYFDIVRKYIKRYELLHPISTEDQDVLVKHEQLDLDKLDSLMKSNGYHVNKDCLNVLLNHLPTSYQLVGANIEKDYLWLCEYETKKLLDKSESEIERIIGIPINNIPLDHSSPYSPAAKRYVLCVEHILNHEGLQYVLPNSMKQAFRQLPDPADPYRSIFREYVDEHSLLNRL